MKDSDIVCDCNEVTVGCVKQYLAKNDISDMELDDLLDELDIGTSCDACLDPHCDFIDVNYRELIDKD